MLTGNTSFPLDSQDPEISNLVEKAKIDTLFVDLTTLYSDIDLTLSKCLKRVFTNGSNKKFKISVSCPILVLEDYLDDYLDDLDYKTVYDFEPIANNQQILTYSKTSGSTGYYLFNLALFK